MPAKKPPKPQPPRSPQDLLDSLKRLEEAIKRARAEKVAK